jgi:hypothetical protein
MGKSMGNLWKNAGNYTEIIWEHGKNHETPMGFNENNYGIDIGSDGLCLTNNQ